MTFWLPTFLAILREKRWPEIADLGEPLICTLCPDNRSGAWSCQCKGLGIQTAERYQGLIGYGDIAEIIKWLTLQGPWDSDQSRFRDALIPVICLHCDGHYDHRSYRICPSCTGIGVMSADEMVLYMAGLVRAKRSDVSISDRFNIRDL